MGKQETGTSATGSVSRDTMSLDGVAPLQSIEIFSVSDFTRSDLSPGDDGLGVFTQS